MIVCVIFEDGVEQVVDNTFGAPKLKVLKQKMELLGISLENSCLPGQYHNLFCPKCKGGQLKERSLSFHIISDGEFAMWRCFRAQCGWAGQVFADDKEFYGGVCANA
ncbi:twinkle homolog protein, chloroplastic/mitochondrial, partial [Cajanus cajan]|uniref:twinkle homolog protein, chloroplastic/mitochondrial n=1 Tax=Cajanus cajan TaxID=3821 RepID=UPI00098D7C6B